MKRKIAVIEDNPDNMMLMEALLADQHTLIPIETGHEALRYVSQHKPDLILLDISLPDVSGVDVFLEMKKNPALNLIPIVALTAHVMVGDREKYLALGFSDYISKPIEDGDVFVAKIDSLMERGSHVIE